MEFWGVEVKAGKALKIEAEDGYMIHVSQAALGETKNGKNECVPLYVKTRDQKFVMGTLVSEKAPQVSMDLFFEQDFELSHNWKNGSVYILGYKSPHIDGGDEELYSDFDESEDEEIPMDLAKIGKPNTNELNLKAKKEQKFKLEDSKNGGESDSDDDESDDDEDDESDSEMASDSEDEEEDEETPKKVEPPSKKRPNGSAVVTPASKKAKTETPRKTDGKKGGNTATPNTAKSGKKGTPKSACCARC